MKKRKLSSNLILFLFFMLVGLAAILSDIFQTPSHTASEMIEQAKLFSTIDLAQIKRISLKNKSGEYLFEKKENTSPSSWRMITPLDISTNSIFMEKLFNDLTVIKIKKIFPDEKMNNSNFSIDKPTSTLGLIDKTGKIINIQIGLINTIDNSMYIKISERPGIYHVEAPTIPLENATILNLIESKILSIDLNTITALKIYHRKKPFFAITKKDEKWLDSEGHIFASEKIDEYIQELSVLKSIFIFEKQTDLQKKELKTTLATEAEYVVSIEDNANNKLDYNISNITKSLKDINLPNEEYFIITNPKSTTVYVAKKEFYDLFSKRIDVLKTNIIKNTP